MYESSIVHSSNLLILIRLWKFVLYSSFLNVGYDRDKSVEKSASRKSARSMHVRTLLNSLPNAGGIRIINRKIACQMVKQRRPNEPRELKVTLFDVYPPSAYVCTRLYVCFRYVCWRLYGCGKCGKSVSCVARSFFFFPPSLSLFFFFLPVYKRIRTSKKCCLIKVTRGG